MSKCVVSVLVLLLATAPAAAQNAGEKPATDARRSAKKPASPPPNAAQKKQEPAEVPPAPKEIKDAYLTVPLAERIAIQSDLVWSGDYNGGVNGDFGDRSIAAVKAFQKRSKGKETGILTPQERASLAASVKAQQDQVGWRIVEDKVISGLRLGIPGRLATQASQGKSGGRWSSARGEVQIETFATKAENGSLAAEFERQKKNPSQRTVEYSVLKPDFFVVSGLQGLKKYYVRAQLKDNDIRGMTILYDQAMEGIMEPVVVAMSSAFAPFESPVDGVSGQRRVEYSTGVIVSALGHVIADRDATNGCNVISVAGMGNAERIGDDVASGLALLQLYGAKAQPIALAAEAPKSSELTLVGIADPQLQGGNKNVSVAAARLGGVSGSTVLLDPAPSQGFSGAAALDAQGQLVGMVEIKPQPAGTPAQAALVPSATIKSFLDNAKITALVGRTSVESAKAAVARVICVRK
jgi:hypothetical protein